MSPNPVVLFVCEHGAAKSIIAAAYFNRLAQEQNRNVCAIARGTHPDPELSLKAVAGLQADGLTPTESVPTKLNPGEIEPAQRVISFCELPEALDQNAPIDYWLDVPPVSGNYQTSRDAILARIHKLIEQL